MQAEICQKTDTIKDLEEQIEVLTEEMAKVGTGGGECRLAGAFLSSDKASILLLLLDYLCLRVFAVAGPRQIVFVFYFSGARTVQHHQREIGRN